MARGNGKAAARKSNGAAQIEVVRLPVTLSDATLLKRADEMADCELQIEKLAGQRAKLAGAARTATKRRLELGRIIDSGEEETDVECAWEPDYAKAVWRLIRLDKRVEVRTRVMTADDLQTSIGDDGAPVPPPRSPRGDKAPKPTARRTRKAASTEPPPAALADPSPAPRRIRTRKPSLTVAPRNDGGPADIVV